MAQLAVYCLVHLSWLTSASASSDLAWFPAALVYILLCCAPAVASLLPAAAVATGTDGRGGASEYAALRSRVLVYCNVALAGFKVSDTLCQIATCYGGCALSHTHHAPMPPNPLTLNPTPPLCEDPLGAVLYQAPHLLRNSEYGITLIVLV